NQIDFMPPPVMIHVIVAEVDLVGNEEFGIQLGLQNPLWFNRGILPQPGFGAGNTVTYTSSTVTGVSPSAPFVPGTITTTNPAVAPGYYFADPRLGLPNNPVVSPNTLGIQGLTDLGLGRISP